jgi:hypothetical protein
VLIRPDTSYANDMTQFGTIQFAIRRVYWSELGNGLFIGQEVNFETDFHFSLDAIDG